MNFWQTVLVILICGGYACRFVTSVERYKGRPRDIFRMCWYAGELMAFAYIISKMAWVG